MKTQLVTLIIVCLLLVGVLWVNQIEPVEVTRIVKVPVIVEKVVYPAATQGELERAYQAIDYGLFAHQFYIIYPSLQTDGTGNTSFNTEWVENYKLFQELLERAYGRVK